MSILDKFSNSGEWRLGSDSNLQFSQKILKTSPITRIEVRANGNKVTGQAFLLQILKEISADSKISNKLKALKDNESVEIIFAGRGEYVLSKAAKSGSVVERTISASFVITNKNPPPIDRSTKPKVSVAKKESDTPRKTPNPFNAPTKPTQSKSEKKKDDAETADIWTQLHEKGEVALD